MSSFDSISEELLCPITLELLEDPITLPCCSRSFSRNAIKYALNISSYCPLCRQYLNIDIDNMPKNTVLSNIIENLNNNNNSNNNNNNNNNNNIKLYKLNGDYNNNFINLQIKLDSASQIKPYLFVCVIDVSGSMSGSPWKQVEKALNTIAAKVENNTNVEFVVISYSSHATTYYLNGSYIQMKEQISKMFVSGGTSFSEAFTKIIQLLNSKNLNDYNNVLISFMTDGQDSSAKNYLSKFKTELNNRAIINCIGFSNNHDFELLDNIRKLGKEEGYYRYAAPTDDDETLCQKIISLFDKMEEYSTIDCEILINNKPTTITKIPTNIWINEKLYNNNDNNNYEILIKTQFNTKNYQIELIETSLEYSKELYINLLSNGIDELAKDTLILSNYFNNKDAFTNQKT